MHVRGGFVFFTGAMFVLFFFPSAAFFPFFAI